MRYYDPNSIMILFEKQSYIYTNFTMRYIKVDLLFFK